MNGWAMKHMMLQTCLYLNFINGKDIFMTNSVQVAPANNVRSLISSMQSHFEKALPAHLTGDRFTRIALTAISKNPKLAQCTQPSLLGALMTFAQLGLEPNTPLGHAYLVPFNNSTKINGQWVKRLEVTPIIGYKGVLDLAYRTGNYQTIDAFAVYKNDHLVHMHGFEEKLEYRPSDEPRENNEKPIKYLAYYVLKNGGKRFRIWNHQDCIEHGKKFSKSFAKGPWQTDTEAMCKKTVLLDLLRYAPLSSEDKSVMEIIARDNATVNLEPGKDIDVEFTDASLIEIENNNDINIGTKEAKELKEVGL